MTVFNVEPRSLILLTYFLFVHAALQKIVATVSCRLILNVAVEFLNSLVAAGIAAFQWQIGRGTKTNTKAALLAIQSARTTFTR